MTVEDHRVIVNPEAFDFHPQLMAEFARELNGWVSEKTERFSDGSPYAKVGGELAPTAVVPLWLSGHIEQQLFRLMEIGNALTHEEPGYPRRVDNILYVFPYLEGRGDQISRVRPDVRKDSYDAISDILTPDGERRMVTGETVYAEMFAETIAGPGRGSRALLLDTHSALVQRYMEKKIRKVLTLSAVRLFAERLLKEELVTENTVVASPDFGALSRAALLAELIHRPLVLCDKWHPVHNNSYVSLRFGDVRGKRVIGIDEVVDTASTIVEGAKVLVDEEGATDVIVMSTGAKLTGPAISRLDRAFRDGNITKVIFTDSLPSANKASIFGPDRFSLINIGPLLIRGIKTLLDPKATLDTYGVAPYVLPDETPLEAYLHYQKQFDLPPLDR